MNRATVMCFHAQWTAAADTGGVKAALDVMPGHLPSRELLGELQSATRRSVPPPAASEQPPEDAADPSVARALSIMLGS